MTTPTLPQPNASTPADYAAAITPHDSTNLPIPARAVYVGTGGDITAIIAAGGNAVLFKNVPGGTILPVRVQRVNATATTATDMVALY